MSSTKMEMSLDDIIKTNPSKGLRRGGGRGGRGNNRTTQAIRGLRRGITRGGGFKTRGLRRGGAGGGGRFSGGANLRGQRMSSEAMWVHDKFQDQSFASGGRTGGRQGLRTSIISGGGGGGGGSKITVSNLHYGVSDADIIELFGELGPIRYASVHYDRSGRSMGKADVVFERRGDAQQAISQYNGIPLDGRSMVITFANQTSVVVSPRVGGGGGGGLRQVQGGRIGRRSGNTNSPVRRGGGVGRGGRGGGGGRGSRGGGGQKTSQPTAAELDAELDAYIQANPK